MMGIDNVMNLGEMLNQVARRYPDAPGFIRNGREHSWKDISRRVDSVAAALRARGLLDDMADAALRERVSARVQAAYDFGRNSPYPEPQDALLHVFAE